MNAILLKCNKDKCMGIINILEKLHAIGWNRISVMNPLSQNPQNLIMKVLGEKKKKKKNLVRQNVTIGNEIPVHLEQCYLLSNNQPEQKNLWINIDENKIS